MQRHTTFNVLSAVASGGLGVPNHGIDPGFSNFQKRFAAFQRRRVTETVNSSDFHGCERIALAAKPEGPGLCYQVPPLHKLSSGLVQQLWRRETICL